jgi:hypothetical protein
MPAPTTAAPPSFYDNLPTGGDSQAGGPSPAKKNPESDADEELMKGFTGVYRVLSKMAKLKKELKPGIDDLKEKIKVLVVQGLKKDPKDLDSGDDKGSDADAGAPPPPPPASGSGGAPPTSTDESHAA